MAAWLIRYRAQVPPIVAMMLFGISLSMSHPLLALLFERAGVSGTWIGISATAPAIAMVTGAPVLPALLRYLGMGWLMGLSCGVLALTLAVIPLLDGFWAWTALRLLYGYAATALFFASEFWIVASAPNAMRGRVVAIYAASLSGSFILGPLILVLTGVDTALPFIVAALIVVVGLGPILWGLAEAPEQEPEARPKPADSLRFFRSDPTVLFAVVAFAMIEYGALALLPVWGLRSGLEEAWSVLLLSAFPLGSMLFLWPIGVLSDLGDRRRLLGLAALIAALAPAAMLLAAPAVVALLVLAGIWGGFAVALYSIALTELGARYTGTALAQANAAVILAYGFGALVSPALFGAAMDTVPPDGLLLACCGTTLAYAALVGWRLSRLSRPSP